MSLTLDPLICNLLLSLNVFLPPAAPPTREPVRRDTDLSSLPMLTVVVPLLDEAIEHVELTVASLLAQTYPKDRLEILFVIEPGDMVTPMSLRVARRRLDDAQVRTSIVMNPTGRRTKPHALNAALQRVRGDLCAFYDAGDTFEREQLITAVTTMIREGHDVAQARVLRHGDSLLGRLLLFDTVTWFGRVVPAVQAMSRGFPLSGEGLFIRTAVLRDTGGFPEVLAEDALLGLLLTQRGKSFRLLETVVVERAPRTLFSHFRQRLRWSRGYLTCLRRALAITMPWRRRLPFVVVFSAPVTSALALLGWLLVLADFIAWNSGVDLQGVLAFSEHPGYRKAVYLWSIALLCGIPVSLYDTWHAVAKSRFRPSALILLLPMYWLFVGFCCLCAPFRGTRSWAKTKR